MNFSQSTRLLIASLAPLFAACVAGTTNTEHLIAREITLVDEQGKPWLHIGEQTSFSRGISLLSSEGESLISIDLEELAGVEGRPDVARVGDQVPVITLESPDGDGIVRLYALRTGGVLSLLACDRTGIDVGVDSDLVNLTLRHEEGGEDKVKLEVVLDLIRLVMTLRSADGAQKELDLRSLLR